MDDREWLQARDAEMQAGIVRDVEAAKAAAARSGKEPFDYEKLCTMYDPSSDMGGEVHDPAHRAWELETSYYLVYRDVQDLRTFAERMREADAWR